MPTSHSSGRAAAAIVVFFFVTHFTASAQNPIGFSDGTAAHLAAPILLNDVADRDFAWGDFDQDGDIDAVVVRRVAFQNVGLPNVLLRNVGGVLTDQTAMFANNSSIPGSFGFADATCDIDVIAVDVTGDGFVDIVTAPQHGGYTQKYLSHPRIYVNQGLDALGQWQGFLFDDENRIPTMPSAPSFISVGAGDIDADGDLDLLLGSRGSIGSIPSVNWARLLVNNGTGYFSDESSTRLPLYVQLNGWTISVDFADMNADGLVDIVKNSLATPSESVMVLTNGSPGPGYFVATPQNAYVGPGYNTAIADLDLDGRPDIIVGSDFFDGYVLNLGVTPPNVTTSFAPKADCLYSGGGSDDGFSGNVRSTDFNLDGYPDVVIADVDFEFPGFTRRCHVYRNRGTAPGARLIEETAAGAVYGIPVTSLGGTFDTATFDVDGDGSPDLVTARNGSTSVWLNTIATNIVFNFPLGRPEFQSSTGPTSVTVDLQCAVPSVSIDPNSARVFYSVNGGAFSSTTLQNVGGTLYTAAFPPLANCNDQLAYYIEAQTTAVGASAKRSPSDAPTTTYRLAGSFGLATATVESFEGSASGWTVVNAPGLTGGAWQLAVPIGTTNAGVSAAPSADSETQPGFSQCFVTQNGLPGGVAGAADVDGGPTTLISPPINLAGKDAVIAYDRWFYASVASRFLTIAVSGNGTTWVTVESVGSVVGTSNTWVTKSFRVSDFITPTATVQVRFQTSDVPNAIIVEAGIDRFAVSEVICSVCQPSLGYAGPGNLALSMCGGILASGTTAELALIGAVPNDVAYIVASFTADLVPVFDGTLVSPNPFYVGAIPTDAAGEYHDPTIPGGLGNVSIFLQVLQVDGSFPQLFAFSNILQVNFLP